MYIYAPCQKGTLEPLGFEVQVVVSHHVVAMEQTQIPWKS